MNIKGLTGATVAIALMAGSGFAGTLDTETTFEDPVVVEESRGSGLGAILIPVLVLGGIAAAVALSSDDGT